MLLAFPFDGMNAFDVVQYFCFHSFSLETPFGMFISRLNKVNAMDSCSLTIVGLGWRSRTLND